MSAQKGSHMEGPQDVRPLVWLTLAALIPVAQHPTARLSRFELLQCKWLPTEVTAAHCSAGRASPIVGFPALRLLALKFACKQELM